MELFLGIATIIGGISGYIALVIALLQEHRIGRPRLKVYRKEPVDEYSYGYRYGIFCTLVITCGQVGTSIEDFLCKVILRNNVVECHPVDIQVISPELPNRSNRTTSGFRIEPYGCVTVTIGFIPELALPIGEKIIAYVQCKYVPGKKTKEIQIPIILESIQ